MPGIPKSWVLMRVQHKVFSAERPRITVALSKLKSCLSHEEGVSVIEFALLSPLLASAILMVGLFGLQINHYIKLDQILRAGATVAITDPGNNAVLERMRTVALEKGYTLGPLAGPGILVLQSARNCFCPGIQGVLGCNQICPGQRPTVARYTLDALFRDALVADLFSGLTRVGFPGGVTFDPFVSTQVTVR